MLTLIIIIAKFKGLELIDQSVLVFAMLLDVCIFQWIVKLILRLKGK